MDLSSAFNIIQPHILTKKLLEQVDLSNSLVGWILAFLTDRTQRVRVNSILSDLKCTSIGSPQGCVLSPLLFILYTNMCRGRHDNRSIIKYVDDSVIVSLFQENESSHGLVTDDFVHRCESYLQLNTLKTKDMVTDFRRKTHMHEVTWWNHINTLGLSLMKN